MTVEEAMLTEARAEVGAADHKASMVLTALGVGFGALLGGLLAGDWAPQQLSSGFEVVWWVGAASAVAAVASASLAVWPRWDASDIEDGIYYWGHVAKLDSLTEARKQVASSRACPEDRAIHQLWHLSRIVARKYSFVRWAFRFAWSAAAFLAVSATFG